MRKSPSMGGSTKLVEAVIQGIQEVKGKDIVQLDLRNVKNAVTDHFIICTGGSDRQVDAIANSIQKTTQEMVDEKPWHSEGRTNAEWVLLDYVNVVVHVFSEEAREHYALDELWGDADRSYIENVA